VKWNIWLISHYLCWIS